MNRFEESLEVITQLLRSDTPVSFDGQYYHLLQATLMPRPKRRGGPRVLIGGNGPERTLPLVARYADEWNAVFAPIPRLIELNARLDELAEKRGRQPADIRRSLMTQVIFGRTDGELQAKLAGRNADELRTRGIVVGTANAVVDQLGKIAEARVQRVMLQWLDLDDMDRLEALAKAVL